MPAPTWDCPVKQASRTATVVDTYRRLFGDRIPERAQYWTLGGASTDADGGPLTGSEVDQVTRTGLCRLDQFHSVERDARIHEANRTAWPHAHWYPGDLCDVLKAASVTDDFHPAVVNFDTMWTPEVAASEVAECLAVLGDHLRRREPRDDGLVFAFNVVLRDPWRHTRWTADEALAPLYAHRLFLKEFEVSDWHQVPACYRYARSRSEMGTFLFHTP